MATYRRSEIVSGLFILLAVTVFALFAFQVGGLGLPSFLEARATSCVTFFPDVKTLQEGVKVVVGGRRVGKVSRIGFSRTEELGRWLAEVPERPAWAPSGTPERAVLQVEFRLDHGIGLRIDPATVRVSLAQEGLLGTHFLSLEPGRVTAGLPLEDLAERLPVLSTPAGGLEEALSEAPALVQRLTSLLSRLEEALLGEANTEAVKEILGNLREASRDARLLTADLQRYADPANPEGLTVKVLDPLQGFIANADRGLEEMKRHMLDVTLAEADRLLVEGKRVLEDGRRVMQRVEEMVQEGDPKVQAALDNLAGITGNLRQRLDEVAERVSSLGSGLEELLAVSRPEIVEILQGIRRGVWEAEILMRKVRANPAVVLWGDSESILDVSPVDESGLRRSGRARPFGQREESDARR